MFDCYWTSDEAPSRQYFRLCSGSAAYFYFILNSLLVLFWFCFAHYNVKAQPSFSNRLYLVVCLWSFQIFFFYSITNGTITTKMKNIWRTFNNLFKIHWDTFNRIWQKAKGLQLCLNLKEHNANYCDVTSTTLFSKTTAAVSWLNYCRYGIKLDPINQPKPQKQFMPKLVGA